MHGVGGVHWWSLQTMNTADACMYSRLIMKFGRIEKPDLAVTVVLLNTAAI
jgi:hypothetical protein